LKQLLAGALLSAAFLLLAAPRADATTVVAKDLGDLCAEADMIFVGKVVSVTSRWADERKQAIETLVDFSVLEPIYGVTTSAVQLSFSGGEVDGLKEVVAGAPQFQPGEEVLIFASKERWISPIIGFHQGCFRVVDSDGGKRVLDAEGHPVSVEGRALRYGPRENGVSGASLSDFLDSVRRQLGERGREAH